MDFHVKMKLNLMMFVVALLSLASYASAGNTDSRVGVELRGNLNLSGFSIGLVGQHVEYQDVDKETRSVDLGTHLDGEVYGQDRHGHTWMAPDTQRVTRTGTTSTKKSDDVAGFGGGIFIPLSADWKKPSVEATGIYGNDEVYGKAGLGYDFKRAEVTIPVSVNASNVALGTNVRHPLADAYLGVDSMGNFDDLSELSRSVVETRENVCSNPDRMVGYNVDLNGCQ